MKKLCVVFLVLAAACQGCGSTREEKKRKPDEKIAASKKAIELAPKYVETHYNLGNVLLAKGDLDGAISAYNKAIALDPKDAKPYCNLGIALHKKFDFDGAVAACKKAIELDPKYAKAYDNLGHVLRYKMDFDGAIAAYKKAIEVDPEYAKAYNNLAATYYYFKKDYGKAWKLIRTVRSKGLGDAINPRFLEDLEKASGRKLQSTTQATQTTP